MLVFHQKAIVESLKTHLSVKDSLAYQPLLEWVGSAFFCICMLFLTVTQICCTAASECNNYPKSGVEFVLCPPAWWCSWPEICRWTSTPTFLISSFWSPRCWTPRTQSCWSGRSPASHISTSTCGGSWWKTWAISTGKNESMSEAITVNWKLNFGILQVTLNSSPSVYTVRFWHTRRSTSASLQQRVFLFWWGRWATTNVKLILCLPFACLS